MSHESISKHTCWNGWMWTSGRGWARFSLIGLECLGLIILGLYTSLWHHLTGSFMFCAGGKWLNHKSLVVGEERGQTTRQWLRGWWGQTIHQWLREWWRQTTREWLRGWWGQTTRQWLRGWWCHTTRQWLRGWWGQTTRQWLRGWWGQTTHQWLRGWWDQTTSKVVGEGSAKNGQTHNDGNWIWSLFSRLDVHKPVQALARVADSGSNSGTCILYLRKYAEMSYMRIHWYGCLSGHGFLLIEYSRTHMF